VIGITAKEGAVLFAVRVSPGASRSRILGEHAGALKLAVAAAPEKGKANKAVIDFLAEALGVRKADVTVVAGETSRDKRIRVTGLDAGRVSGKLSELVSGSPSTNAKKEKR
jgi:uncharacterized protein (TIGR00251 family)